MAKVLSKDMKDLLEIFERRGVDYAIVGGFAVVFYGYPRHTRELDLLIFPSKENASRVMDALEEFGFGSAGIPKEFFERRASAIHLGAEPNQPNRIDLLTKLEGLDDESVRRGLQQTEFDGCPVRLIGLRELLEAKRNSGRAKDLADVEELKRANPRIRQIDRQP